jgi:DNA-directed RNA polymerase specialized sigma24 family protein
MARPMQFVDPDGAGILRDAPRPTDEEVLDAMDSALFALRCRGASYRQLARALGHPLVTAYRRIDRVQPHVKARVKDLYGLP